MILKVRYLLCWHCANGVNFYQSISNCWILMRTRLITLILVILLVSTLAEAKKKPGKEQVKARDHGQRGHQKEEHAHYLTPDKPQFWLNVLLAAFLALGGGFCSGMTVGLNSLSKLNLQVMEKSSDQADKRMAERILGVIHDHHLFLVTLLVGNAIVLQSLPLVIHLIMPDWAAILFSTVIVLIVAEVVPMSMSTGPRKYIIAYYGAPLVAIMIKLFWPVCYPIARGLDKLLQSDHEERILRRDFLTFINDKQKNFLDQLQIEFINQVMNHKNKTVKQVMIPVQCVFMLQENTPVTEEIIRNISNKEHSFMPVYRKDPSHIVGYVSSKEIIMNYLAHDIADKIPLKTLVKGKIVYKAVRIYSDAVAVQALQVIEKTRAKILLVNGREKHEKKSHQGQMSIISVYSTKQWIVQTEDPPIGFITLNQVLHEVADYRTTTLKSLHRKLSNQPQNDEQI